MPSGLPSDSALDKSVNTFGIGMFDSPRDNDGDHGEDSEDYSAPESLPQDGGPFDPFGPDRLLSYPQNYTSQGKHAFANSIMPGDIDRPFPSRRPNDDTVQSVVHSESQSKLPQDGDNPAARSDYYDKLQTSQTSVDDIWPDEDPGVYANSELPTIPKNEVQMDNFLGALGNYLSGYEVEDVSGPNGSPSEDFMENVNYDRSDLQDGGRVLAAWQDEDNHHDYDDHDEFLEGDAVESMVNDAEKSLGRPMTDEERDEEIGKAQHIFRNRKIGTDISLVNELTKNFMKEYGKKNLTRRHVMGFLTSLGQPQYLASDIIRCLKHVHKLVIPDVLDTFPAARVAHTNSGLSWTIHKLTELQLENILDPESSFAFAKCSADLSQVLAILDSTKIANRSLSDDPYNMEVSG